jgi:hypothetical protein
MCTAMAGDYGTTDCNWALANVHKGRLLAYYRILALFAVRLPAGISDDISLSINAETNIVWVFWAEWFGKNVGTSFKAVAADDIY